MKKEDIDDKYQKKDGRNHSKEMTNIMYT